MATSNASIDIDSLRRSLGPDHPTTLGAMYAQAGHLDRDQGQHAEAEPLWREALRACRATYDAQNAVNIIGVCGLAACLVSQEKVGGDARDLCRELQALRWEVAFRQTPVVVDAVRQLATCLHAQQQYGLAEPIFRRLVAFFPNTEADVQAVLKLELADCVAHQARHAEAEPLFQSVYTHLVASSNFGQHNSYTIRALCCLAACLIAQQKHSAADPLCRDVRAALQGPGQFVKETMDAVADLAIWLQKSGRRDAAEQLLRTAMCRREELQVSVLAPVMTQWALCLLDKGQPSEAAVVAQQVFVFMRQRHGMGVHATLDAMSLVATCQSQRSKHDQAISLFTSVARHRAAIEGSEVRHILDQVNLAESMEAAGRDDDAQAVLDPALWQSSTMTTDAIEQQFAAIIKKRT